MSKRLVTILSGAALLTAGTAQAGVFPANPTVYDEVQAVLTYPCPYPSEQHTPRITQQNENIYVDVVTNGTVCFSNVSYPRVELSYNLGRLPAGFYRVWVRHIDIAQLTPAAPPFYWHTVSRPFSVTDRIPERISGTWYDPSQPGYGFHINLIDAQQAFVLWATYDQGGDPMWLSAMMRVSGTTLLGNVHRFQGESFNRANIQQSGVAIGRVTLDLTACDTLRARWESDAGHFAAGQAQLVNLVRPFGVEGCRPVLAEPSDTPLPGPRIPSFR